MSSALAETCDTLMRRSWEDSMTKRRYSSHDLGRFVTYSIQWSPDPIGRVKSLLNNAISDFMEELTDQPKKENGTEAYPTLKYTTFNLYYAPMFQYLVEKWENDICNRPIAKRLVHKVYLFFIINQH